MERAKAQAVIEAILFAMGESVEISRLADVIEEDKKTTKQILNEMAEQYQAENRGFLLSGWRTVYSYAPRESYTNI